LTWKKIQKLAQNPYSSERLRHLDKNADIVFYLTYFFVAAFFSVLTSILMLYLFDDQTLFPFSQNRKDFIVCFLVLMIGITQFVVTPYDAIGYFFEAFAMLLFLKYLKTKNRLLYLGFLAAIVLATFNRESSLIIVSFTAAIFYTENGFSKKWFRQLLLPALCFAIPYLILKLLPGKDNSFTNESQLIFNFNITNPYSVMGLLFSAFIIYFMLHLSSENRQVVKYFLLFTSPYIVIILIVGLLLEFRLWVPLLQAALVLAALNFASLDHNGHKTNKA
jgi:hypothetical protein